VHLTAGNSVFEFIPYVAHCIDKCMNGVLDLAAQPPDMYVHRPVPAVIIVAPHLIEQSFACENPALIGCQQPEQFILLEGQRQKAAGQLNLTPDGSIMRSPTFMTLSSTGPAV